MAMTQQAYSMWMEKSYGCISYNAYKMGALPPFLQPQWKKESCYYRVLHILEVSASIHFVTSKETCE